MIADEVFDYWYRDALAEPDKLPERMKFWFGDPADDPGVTGQRDDEIRRLFEQALHQAARGEFEDWNEQPVGRAALIILLDQFPRNIYRGSAQAFAYDSIARAQCLQGLDASQDQALPPLARVFFYLPLEHSESLRDQQRCVELMRQLESDVPTDRRQTFATFTRYAIDHMKIIERFGRFPHRNRLLGRDDTPEEAAYLAAGATGFGQ